jgi:hypothetical protein
VATLFTSILPRAVIDQTQTVQPTVAA